MGKYVKIDSFSPEKEVFDPWILFDWCDWSDIADSHIWNGYLASNSNQGVANPHDLWIVSIIMGKQEPKMRF